MSSPPASPPSSPEPTVLLPLASEQPAETPSHVSSAIASCNCCSAKKIAAITLIVGAVLLILGLVVFAAAAAPTSHKVLMHTHTFVSHIAGKLGTDLFAIGTFFSILGTSCIVAASATLCSREVRVAATPQTKKLVE